MSAISFPTIQDGTLQEMVLFILPPAPDCLLAAHISKEKIAPKCFPIDLRQDGYFGFCSGGWIINRRFLNLHLHVPDPFPEAEMEIAAVFIPKIQGKFPVPGERKMPSQAAWILSENLFPQNWLFCLKSHCFLWKVDCCKIFLELQFHFWPMREELMGLEARFEQNEHKLWLWMWSCETSQPYAPKPRARGHFWCIRGMFSDLSENWDGLLKCEITDTDTEVCT